jgi:hypothetical protein
MGAAKTFLDNKDVSKKFKCQKYIAGPLNALLWGCTTWNLKRRNLDRHDSLPKKFLAALISGSRKNGAPQLTCNNNFPETINKIHPQDKPLSSKTAPLKEWVPHLPEMSATGKAI